MTTTAVMQTQLRTVDGLRIRYAESNGPHERTVLLTSPWPESVYAFVPIWSSLERGTRACSPSTCQASAPPSAATSFSRRGRWAGS